ncbi:type II toxin-antitoxin system RelE/ParE family toxin [Cupriavidus sp. KB_39]|uniref:type II toxin-antitoxin system RelE/ParE family toxin n=1 Tax=Cupriavidus sp. KB_39 TaxID=3233036 RepID=UPI003F8F2847
MIRSFAHKGLERFFTTGSTAAIPAMHAKRLRLILALLDGAASARDMDAPGLRLHALKGDRAELWADGAGELAGDLPVRERGRAHRQLH